MPIVFFLRQHYYLLFLLCSFTVSVALHSLSFSAILQAELDASMNTLFVFEPVISLHTLGAHNLPRFCCKPARMQRYCHEPLCDLLITLLPSNLDHMCIHDSAKFVVNVLDECKIYGAVSIPMYYTPCVDSACLKPLKIMLESISEDKSSQVYSICVYLEVSPQSMQSGTYFVCPRTKYFSCIQL